MADVQVDSFFDLRLDHPSCITLGNFDGVHVGHQQLLRSLVKTANEKIIESVALTFSPHPSEFIRKIKTPLVMPLSERLKKMQSFGVDHVHAINFNAQLAGLNYQEFIDILIASLSLRVLVVGENTRIGKKQEGTPEKIQAYCQLRGVKTVVLPLESHLGKRVSSSQIRRLLSEGNVKLAHEMLGEAYCVFGSVVKGKQVGASIGRATANLIPDASMCVLKNGVYQTQLKLKGKWWPSVTNIGTAPSVSDSKQVLIETHVLDYEGGAFYGEEVRVGFIDFLRDERKFDSLDALKHQIAQDVACWKT